MYVYTYALYIHRCVCRRVQKVNTLAADIRRQTMQINCKRMKERVFLDKHRKLVPCTEKTKTFSMQSTTLQTPFAITLTKLHNDIMQQGKSKTIHKAHEHSSLHIHTPYTIHT